MTTLLVLAAFIAGWVFGLTDGSHGVPRGYQPTHGRPMGVPPPGGKVAVRTVR